MKPLSTLLFLIAFPVIAADTGTLKGIFKYDGEPPKPKVLNVNKDKAGGCPHEGIIDESLVVDPQTRTIKWGIVRIMDVPAGPLEPQKPVVISQEGCKYTPRVIVSAPGMNVTVRNPDKRAHMIHAVGMDGINQPFGRMMLPDPTTDSELLGKKTLPDLFQIQCMVHPWMRGFVVVHDPRYAAVTAEDGKFVIENIPPGKYKVLFNHDLGEQEKDFEIKKNETTDAGEILFKQK